MSRLRAAAFAMLVLAGCGPDLLVDLDRVEDDPVVTAPSAASFAAELTIDVSWDTDPGADRYVLERAADAVAPVWAQVYAGIGTALRDTSCADQGRYLYRLTKTRGSRSFGPSAAVLGVGSATRADALEPNDTESLATDLAYDRSANLYYYRSYSAEVVQDRDWYTVTVPPRRIAEIVVTQAGLAATDTYMMFALTGSVPQQIINNAALPIANSAYEARTFAFQIYPNPDEFVAGPSLAGGSTIDYTVSLYRIVSL